jgi:uncharacterized protein YyaL (SSP411 family)
MPLKTFTRPQSKVRPMISTILLLVLALLLSLSFSGTAAEPDPNAKPNHLIHESSPYLLQHAHNPVDWYPWGKEAMEKAKKEHKPIFLSVGYSTCHWCHVMAHESFEDAEVAKVMNELYVCIKVDREELPNVDEQYMVATQIFTQRGGWPNSVWLTPDGRPWYAGTYFPKEDRGGRPGFISVLNELAKVWKEQPEQVEAQAARFTEAIRSYGERMQKGGDAALSPETITRALRGFRDAFDDKNGGFGGAPKFPPHGILALLLQQQTAAPDLGDSAIITATLDAMAAGGVYDHVGGGFARYSTDSRWFLPHFEKMLYDNAQLIRAYSEAAAQIGVEPYKKTIAQTFDWLTREMTDPAGGFYSALDADSEGVEGKFYLWTYDEILAVLGEADGPLFAKVYGATEAGNYAEEATGEKTGENILFLKRPLAVVAKEMNTDEAKLAATLEPLREKLLDVRNKRIHPHLDDKVLSGWNGLMIAGLAHAGKTLENKAYTDAAAKAASFVLTQMRDKNGHLLRSWRKGEAKVAAYLDDYAFFIDGLLELHAATKQQRWLDEAKRLTDIMVAEFYDAQGGGFYFTNDRHDALLLRAKELGGGGNSPSGNGVAADVLLRLAAINHDKGYAEKAGGTLRAFAGMMNNNPHGSEALLLALAHAYALEKELPKIDLSPRKVSDADAVAVAGVVTIEAYTAQAEAKPGATIDVAVRFTINKGYHIYASTVDPAELIPTSLKIGGEGFAEVAGAAKWPEPKLVKDPVLGKAIAMYEGEALVTTRITVSPTAKGGEGKLELKIEVQACDDRVCLQPQRKTLTVAIKIGGEGEKRHAGVFGAK